MSAAPKMSVEEMIQHYQRSIERSQDDPDRILHCLNKLKRMNVTVEHLQSTGIGRTVNALRKDDGEVGSMAKTLISKWKQMVQSEPSDQSEEGKANSDQECSVDSSNKQSKHNNEHTSTKHNKNSSSSSSSHSNSKTNHSRDHKKHKEHKEHKTINDENEENSSKKHSHDKDRSDRHKSSSDRTKEDRHRKSESSRHSSDKHSSDSKRSKHNGSHDSQNVSSSMTNSTSSHKRHREHDNNEQQATSSMTKRQKCDADSTTSPLTTQKHHTSKDKKSSKSKHKPIDDGIEIDHSTGTSFEDALGMIEPVSNRMKSSSSSSSGKNSKTTSSSSSALSSREKTSSTSASSSSSSSSISKSTTSNNDGKKSHKDKSKPSTSTSSTTSNKSQTPVLLTTKVKLPPLEDLSIELPPPTECVIRNDYKPLPVNPMVMDVVYRPQKVSTLNETAALCASTTSKNQRTKVYSGAKSGQLLTVPTLHELCIRFLQKNIDALEYTGGVPFEILRPVLERATPQQLYSFEHYNPYLMDDSDVLWQQHCKNKFKTYKRQEMETWREMYARCEKEQEDRLNSLANNIKKSQSVAVPVRQTKLAYVDSAVKPPRGIVKKQYQFGTQNQLVASPASRVEALAGSIATNVTKAGDSRLRTIASMRDTAQAQPPNGGVLKPRKAPLMMKTLQLMKGRFKR